MHALIAAVSLIAVATFVTGLLLPLFARRGDDRRAADGSAAELAAATRPTAVRRAGRS